MKIKMREKLRFRHSRSEVSRTMAVATPVQPAVSSALQKPAREFVGGLLDLAHRHRRALSFSPLVCFTVLYLAETLLPKPLSADLRNCVDLFRF